MKINEQLEANIRINQIVDWCANNKEIIFYPSLTSGFTCVRFTTPLLDSQIGLLKQNTGFWGNGRVMMYEIENADRIVIHCVAGLSDISSAKRKQIEFLAQKFGKEYDKSSKNLIIKTWGSNDNNIIGSLDSFYNNDLLKFETQIKNFTDEYNKILEEEQDVDLLFEGYIKELCGNKYERSRKARQQCIEYYGPVCQICGFDFKEVYGDEFAGRIDVHHIKPLSEIGKGYKVDPIKDLIPVCPNCHAACHYRKDGVWQPDQIIERIKLNHKN